MRFAALALLFALFAQPGSASDVNAAALTHLVERARATHSNALVVIVDGNVVENDNFDGGTHPQLVMSIAKSFCALAALSLAATNKLSLGRPIGQLVPEWSNDARASITLHETLAMTTGLADPFRTNFTIDGDDQAVLRASALLTPPGSAWRYNNNAIDLVDIAVHSVVNEEVDDYLQDQLFSPLGIAGSRWDHDRAHHAACAAGLWSTAADLARVGQLLLDDGVSAGKRVLPSGMYAQLAQQSQPYESDYGLGWWLLRNGSAPGSPTRQGAGPVVGIEAIGSGGQYLYVSQTQHIVAVRLIDARRPHEKDDSFDDFEAAVAAVTAIPRQARDDN
jgi:CubicO group peptidase (beta-lactamase class C family)